MTALHSPGSFRLLHGDCREQLATLPADSVHSIVTDPPYELGFMGKSWDSTGVAFDPEMWAEALRVLKPGGYMLAFCGSRTFHRMVCAIEDAGFEIRDSLMWMYGTGFPKGQNISKAIDRAGGVHPREQAAALSAARLAAGLDRSTLADIIGCTESSIRDWEEGRARSRGGPTEWLVPSPTYRKKLSEVFGYTEDVRSVSGEASPRAGDGTVIGLGHSGTLYGQPVSDLAAQWDGWNTQLKPAYEPIVLARKAPEGTVVNNVLEHGVGGLNIDGCRVGRGVGDRTEYGRGNHLPHANTTESLGDFAEVTPYNPHDAGRYPANVILDEEAAAALDEQSGFSKSPKTTGRGAGGQHGITRPRDGQGTVAAPGDEGGASRFFYTAKASKKDRNYGMPEGAKNSHATVKPQDLMRYLCRLVTPPDGIVLDPFMGSGTTGVAAILEGFRFLGIEQDGDYITDLAAPRIAAALDDRGDA